MARYRPVDVRLWNDRRFLSLSDRGKLLWLFFLTTPSTVSIPGVIVSGEAALAEQLGWTTEQFREQFQELVRVGMKVRAEGRVVWLSNALKYQPPKNPNTVKAWAKAWDEIPECCLKKDIWEALRISCKSWDRLFTKLFPKQFGEQFAQLFMEQFDTRTRSETRTRTETRSGSRSLSSEPEPEVSEPPPDKPSSNVIPMPAFVDADRERKRREIYERVSLAHVQAFGRVKKAIGSTAWGPGITSSHEALRSLLAAFPVLDEAEDQLMHALAVREAEALRKRTLQFFGTSMWKQANFEKAISLEVADVNGQRRDPGSRPSTGLQAILEDIAEDERRKQVGDD